MDSQCLMFKYLWPHKLTSLGPEMIFLQLSNWQGSLGFLLYWPMWKWKLMIYKIVLFLGKPSLMWGRTNHCDFFGFVCFFACSMPTVCHKVHCNEKETWAIQTSPLTSLFTINTLGNCTWKKCGWWFFLLFRFFWGKNVLQVDGEEKMLHSHSEMKVWVHWRDGMLNSGFRRKA